MTPFPTEPNFLPAGGFLWFVGPMTALVLLFALGFLFLLLRRRLRRFSNVLLVALLVFVALLAGCINGEPNTARDAEQVARRKTSGQANDLLAAVAVESSEAFSDAPDAHVGDGRAATWYFAYGTGGPAAIVRVDGRHVRMASALPGPLAQLELPSEPLDGLALNSDAALRIAKSDSGFAAVVATPGAVVYEAAGKVAGVAVWHLVAHADGRSAFVTVDSGAEAVLRAVVEDETTPEQLFPRSGHDHGGPMHLSDNVTLTSAAPVKEYEFAAREGATLELQAKKDLPVDRLAWTILDNVGEPKHSGKLAELAETSDYESVDLDLEAGAYTLRLTLETVNPLLPPQGTLEVGMVLLPN